MKRMYKIPTILMLAFSLLLQVNASANDIVTREILGTGTAALLTSDLTDPDNNGLDALDAATDPSWNWVSIDASHEPNFEGGENAFNIFDNKVGGGNNKWCCDDPTVDIPVWVAVEFANPVSITHFTVTTGNDSRDRDPTDWQIQGSNDGATYFPIYAFQGATAFWATDTRNQVIKFTLLSPSAPYKFIRYIAFATPGTLHQINEIEYFGTTGGTDKIAVSGMRAGLASFTFSATDVGASVVDPATTTLTINGAPATLTNVKDAGVTTFTHTPAAPFPAQTNTFVVTAKDAQGATVTVSGSFVTPAYAVVTAADKVTPDTTKAGFNFNVHQNSAFQVNTTGRAENQLAGTLGENLADPAAQGPALAAGVAGANNRLPIHFEVETFINMEQEGLDAGDINPNDTIPGIPGLNAVAPASMDGIAAEIITYVELPAGLHTFIFNSDDGFQTTVGEVNDVFKARVAGVFQGGRGAADTPYPVYAPEAGVYAFRTVWYEGGGGANLEWKTVAADGVTEVLLNDTANGGFKAYRALTTPAATAITSVTPFPNQTGVAGNIQLAVTISEGSPAIDLNSVKLSLNDVQTADVATKSGNVITITHQPTALLASNSTNKASITYTAGGVTRTENWTFIVESYQNITADKRATADQTKPGFIWNVHESNNADQGANLRALKQLAGLYGHNYADPAAQGYALAPGVAPADPNLPILFEIETVINMDQAGGSNGQFTPDEQMPGIPGLALNDGALFEPTDGIAAEILTYIELPAGRHTLVFNSDDGFRAFGGNARDMFDAQVLGQFDAGRGAADTAYTIFVESAGFYPFRTTWFEGGGGANLEWKYVKPDGTRALINDTANGGPRAFRAATAGHQTAITKVSPWPGYARVSPKEAIEVTIEEGDALVADASIQLSLNGAPVSPAATVTRNGKTITVRHLPTTAYTGGATNTAKIAFTVGGAAREEEWTFVTPVTTPDKLNSYPAMLIGRVAISADAGGRTGQAGDRSADYGTTGGTAPGLLTADPALMNAINTAATADTLTVSFWQKKYANTDSSAFWFDSPRSMQAMRGFQAHTPWSNGRVYFDTAGCCGANLSRIDQIADDTTIPGYTGLDWWTNQWHHFAFVKNGAAKEIWIDGVLFHSGTGDPLNADIVRAWIGGAGGGPDSGPGNGFPGLIDDFAIFGSALAEADIVALKNGTAPSALPVATNPLAWWDFNTGGVTPPPTLSATISANNISITFTGKLQSSPVIGTGAVWTDVSTTGTHSESASTGNKFFRAVSNP